MMLHGRLAQLVITASFQKEGGLAWREGSYYGALGLQVISSVKVLTDHQALIGTGST